MTPADRAVGRGAPAYRRDIDGLRAIAVCAVILAHVGIAAVPGGFLGVDIFFVISGFLIHGAIAREMRAGRFSPLAFYAKRMRRTLPALYVVILASLAFGALVCVPGEFAAFAGSAIAAATSVSNILFLTKVGYFDHDALTKPLLHTWSLGVEEQFYLVAPLLSVAFRRVGDRLRPHLYLGGILVTFVAAAALQHAAPASAFYLMPARIFEFLIGGAVAENVVPKITRAWLAELVAAAALVALLGTLILCSETTPHPGPATLLICLASATLIHVGTNQCTATTMLLGNKVAAFLGLISYSLYLWHWPMLVFARDLGWRMDAATLAGLAILLLALSTLSWRFVEQPFRTSGSVLRRHARPVLGGAMATVLLASLLVVTGRGLPGRFPPDIATVTSYFDYSDSNGTREGVCFLSSKSPDFRRFDKTACLKASATKPNHLLIGDSTAAHQWFGLEQVMPEINVMQATVSNCRPLLQPRGRPYCDAMIRYLYDDYLPSPTAPHIDEIILEAVWQAEDAPALAETLAYLKRFVPHVVVLGPLPSHDMNLPSLIGRSRLTNDPSLIRRHQENERWAIEAALKAALPIGALVSQLDLLCPEHDCIVMAAPGVPLQYDEIHPTTEGALLIARRLRDTNALAPLRHISNLDP